MADQDLDRNEAATPYKLQKAREKGQVGKSADVVSAAVFTVAVAYLYWQGWDGMVTLFGQGHAYLSLAGNMASTPAALWNVCGKLVTGAALMLLPFLAAVMLAAIISNIAQTGPVLSAEPLKPDFDRLNPMSGFKRLFSRRTLFDAARNTGKLLLMSLAMYYSLRDLAPRFFRLSAMPAGQLARTLVENAASIGFKFALLLCVIAAIDFGFTRREFDRKMRMSKREVKDEHKNREGDPRIRSRLRELRREAMARSMAARKTSTADVVLTNPTHYAVALRYVHGEMQSPQLVAKGAGTLAGVMREIAARHRIPVVQSPPLARELYRSVGVEQHVPPALYAQVARILVWVFAMKRAREGGLGAAA